MGIGCNGGEGFFANASLPRLAASCFEPRLVRWRKLRKISLGSSVTNATATIGQIRVIRVTRSNHSVSLLRMACVQILLHRVHLHAQARHRFQQRLQLVYLKHLRALGCHAVVQLFFLQRVKSIVKRRTVGFFYALNRPLQVNMLVL